MMTTVEKFQDFSYDMDSVDDRIASSFGIRFKAKPRIIVGPIRLFDDGGYLAYTNTILLNPIAPVDEDVILHESAHAIQYQYNVRLYGWYLSTIKRSDYFGVLKKLEKDRLRGLEQRKRLKRRGKTVQEADKILRQYSLHPDEIFKEMVDFEIAVNTDAIQKLANRAENDSISRYSDGFAEWFRKKLSPTKSVFPYTQTEYDLFCEMERKVGRKKTLETAFNIINCEELLKALAEIS